MMIVAQITDLHVRPDDASPCKYDTNASLEVIVDAINGRDTQPDIILATGDLGNVGDPGEYAAAKKILDRLKTPYFIIPGNHDARAPLIEAFHDHPYMRTDNGYIQYTLEDYPIRLIGLDTLEDGKSGGTLCDERLAWLSDRLDERRDRPTIVFMHHPPFGVSMKPHNVAAFRAIIERHPQVERVISGHIHRVISARFAGTMATVSPSTCYAFAFAPPKPGEGLQHSDEPPGYQLHIWRPEMGLATHTVFVPAAAEAGRAHLAQEEAVG